MENRQAGMLATQCKQLPLAVGYPPCRAGVNGYDRLPHATSSQLFDDHTPGKDTRPRTGQALGDLFRPGLTIGPPLS